jgi:hypothetical protein
MNSRKWHAIWTEQCEAARDVKARYGLDAALDYLITEKLLNFARAAATHPEFARELPRFVGAVRGIFTSEEIRTHVALVERKLALRQAEMDQDDEDGFFEDAASAAEEQHRFALISELLTAPDLGTS